MQTRFYSGTVIFWVDWDRQEVVGWFDPAQHGANGRGLPAEFTITDGCMAAVSEYISSFVGELEFPDYQVFYDAYKGTYDVLLKDLRKIALCRISKNGNAVLLHGLSPRAAFEWLIAVMHDNGYLKGNSTAVEKPEKFGDLYVENEQGGDE
jgi:hypothetical protein